ncbi:cysteine-rich small domain-containing protein [Marichromatium sp. AB31]|uniref:cysteine-rich small domain-containing protein n=1 Tax=Marichromatium sp. AB31 TaxID=2483362 RepID=UPI000F3B2FD8|nr:cysteine-rich small domain-containing protein [Marichromatium sp. AB31]RNE89032.1 cobalamine-related hypothetical metal-binding protein CrdX [Marichromatium sp. AB31]
MTEPKELTNNPSFKGFTNHDCPFYPCHPGVRRTFNCLFCYCPLIAYDCPGPYRIYTDRHGNRRKDCTDCRLPHEGYHSAWSFIQKWLDDPRPWCGEPQQRYRRRDPS